MDRIQCQHRQACGCVNGAAKESPDKEPPSESTKMRTLLARLISAWIKAHGHPLKCVAGRIGVAESTICQWARGKRFPSPDNLDDLARCAGVPTICLLCPCLVQAYEQVALARERSGTLHAGSNTPIAER